MFKTIIAAQSTNVDVVSGATYSSAGIIEAVRNALSQAVGDSAQKSQNSDQQGESDEDTEHITGTVPFIDGIFYGTGEGYRGDIEVAVVIKDKTINTILITKQEDDKKFMDRAKEVAERVVQTQSTKVDVISGATYSSKGILQAIKNALGEAKKATLGETEVQPEPTPEVTITPEMTPIPGPEETELIYLDGEYQAAVLCVPDENEDFEPYQLSLTITVKNDNIVAITDVAGDGDPDNESYIDRALNGTSKYKGVVAQILEKGKPEEIDTVSRATCSSKSIIEACRQALNNAKRTEKTES